MCRSQKFKANFWSCQQAEWNRGTLNFRVNLIFIEQSGLSDKLVRASLALLLHQVISSISRWSHGLRRGSAAARLLGLRVRIPPGSWMSVPCKRYVLSGRSLCDGLIIRPWESYRVCMSECDREASLTRTWPNGGCYAMERRHVFHIMWKTTGFLFRHCCLHLYT